MFFQQTACEVESTSPPQDQETRKWEDYIQCNYSPFQSEKASHINKDLIDEVFFWIPLVVDYCITILVLTWKSACFLPVLLLDCSQVHVSGLFLQCVCASECLLKSTSSSPQQENKKQKLCQSETEKINLKQSMYSNEVFHGLFQHLYW